MSVLSSQFLHFAFHFCFLTYFLLALSACNETFQPLQENNKFHFAIYGYLDADADTQWIRVGTVRQRINEPPDPNGIRVTLEELQSSETVVMNDSLFTSRNVLNYWTTMDIKHEQTYKITAEHSDGKTSWVTVTTPTELPTIPNITLTEENPIFNDPPGARIYIDGAVEHIADVQSVWYVILNPETENRRRIFRFPLRNNLMPTFSFSGAYSTFANHAKERATIGQSVGDAEILVAARQFFVAAGGPEWDDSLSSLNDFEYFLNETASNVEDGLGYVVGIDTKWFRQRECLTHESSNIAPCEPEEPYWK